MRILVVDDEHLVAETVSIIFRKHGFEVATAFSAVDALALARLSRPDLVLCDINMPGRDGVDLMEDLGREIPSCPILVLTGLYANHGRITDCAVTYKQRVRILAKPCPPLELLREADSLLQLRA